MDKFRGIGEQRELHRQEASVQYDESSRELLKKNIERKIRTTMIGALAVMEQKFGFLWGQGKHRSQLTAQEKEFEQLKEDLRTEILNLGNNQLRAAMAELGQYDVTWKRHQFKFDAHTNINSPNRLEEGR